MQRRVLLFEFGRPVVHGDMMLNKKLEAELPAILAKCNRAYLEMSARYASVNVWTVLPQYFRDTRQELAQSVNCMEAFLASDEVVYGPGLYCPFKLFAEAVKQFEHRGNFKPRRHDKDFFAAGMTQRGLRREKASLTYQGQRKSQEYVFGVDLSVNCGDGADERDELS